MKVKSISFNKRKDTVYDIETPSHDYILSNGIISHNTMEMFSKAVVSGGTGIMYSADTVIIFGRQQEKDGELLGYNFILNVEKSRFVKEKSKIPLKVLFDGGIVKYSGVLDLALDSGHVIKPKNGYYQLVDVETGELLGVPVKEAKTYCDEFLGVVASRPKFKEYVKNKYKLTSSMMTAEDVKEDTLADDEEEV